MVSGSAVVITICQELQDTVAHMGMGERALLIENVMGGDVDEPPSPGGDDVRAAWGIAPGSPLALYTGTFEPYQGLDLLMAAAARLAATHPHARVLVVGGEASQVVEARDRAAEAGAGETMVFAGQQPAREIPRFVAACDVLVSPRIRGTNTPLKIYSYLRSGKPIVATDLLTHTQVLTSQVARLVPPDARALAAAVGSLLDDPAERDRLGAAARQLADEKYSRAVYLARTAEACARLMRARGPRASAGGRSRAVASVA
jgi:glycosyltransferase involved in cell wall biosynthesis